MNLPNKLTIFRIILVPIIMLIPIIDNLCGISGEFLGISTAFWIMNIIFIIASITDKLDGYIARSRNQVTTFGKFLDPLADKLLVLTLLLIVYDQCNYYGALYFAENGGGKELDQLLRWWMVLLILAREFMVTGIRLVSAGKKQVIAASWYGKVKTTLQFVTLIVMLAGCAVLENPDTGRLVPYNPVYVVFVNILIIATLAMTIFSGYDYVVKNIGNLKDDSVKKKNKSHK